MSFDNFSNILVELTSGDDARSEAAVQEVHQAGNQVLPEVKKLLASPDADTRWWAVRALAVIDHPSVPDLLIQALHDPNSSVQECAALALFAHPTPQAIPDLIALIGGENALLSRLSADSLVQIGSLAVPALLEALENGLQPVRLEAVRALALIADRSTIPALFASLEDDSALIAYWAEEGLERMGVGMRFFIP